MNNSRFQRGHGVYNCGICGRATRGRVGDSVGNGSCGTCFDLAGIENSLTDSGNAQETIDEYRSEVTAGIAFLRTKKDANLEAFADLISLYGL